MIQSLNFEANGGAVCKKGHQSLSCLRWLAHFHNDKTIILLCFYWLCFSPYLDAMVWILSHKELSQIVKWSNSLIGEPQLNPTSQYTRWLRWLVGSVLLNELHPLHIEFQFLPSRRRFQA